MPLASVKRGSFTIRGVQGGDKISSFLSSLGFIPGQSVNVVSGDKHNMIVSIMGTRIALNEDMVNRISIY